MSEHPRPEDEIVLEALESLEEGGDLRPTPGPAGRREPGEAVERPYLETLGLIPYELPPLAPPPSVKERLMARVAASGRGDGVAPFRPRPTFSAPDTQRSRLQPWLRWAVAAVVVLLFGSSGWLLRELRAERSRVNAMSARLAGLEGRGDAVEVRGEVITALRRLGLLPSTPVDVCPLRPVGEPPLEPAARGMLFIRAHDGGRWYLRIHGLPPAPAGEVYQLWFLGPGRALRGAVLEPGNGEGVEAMDAGMPSGPMVGVAVTLEPSREAAQPTGPRVLFGDARDMVRL